MRLLTCSKLRPNRSQQLPDNRQLVPGASCRLLLLLLCKAVASTKACSSAVIFCIQLQPRLKPILQGQTAQYAVILSKLHAHSAGIINY